MKSKDILSEVVRLGMSPTVLTGQTTKIMGALRSFLDARYSEDEFLVLDSVRVADAEALANLTQLRGSALRFVLVNSDDVSTQAWQYLFKVLDNLHAGIQLIFVSNGDIPRAIETRCFRCHVPSKGLSLLDYAGSEAFAVGSWLISLDNKDREQLLKSCRGWSSSHTALLLAELDSRLCGETLLQLDLKRLNNNKIMAAIFILNKYKDSPTAPVYAGMRLLA